MLTRTFFSCAVSIVFFLLIFAQDARATLDTIAAAMGGTNLKTIQCSGSGFNFAVGQSVRPGAPWPRFVVKSFTRIIDYENVASREELLRTQGENPPRGGGGQPMSGEQRQVLFVSGQHAWNQAGSNVVPAPANLEERLLQIWITPHGVIKAASQSNAKVTTQTKAGKKITNISFTAHGKYKVSATVNDQNLVENVQTWIVNPVLGNMLVETTYSDYRYFNGVKFPTRIVQKQGGFPALDFTIAEVQPNAAVSIQVPENVRQAAAPLVRVESQKLADGIWYLTGGSHHSVAIAFKDHAAVVEAPLNADRSKAVIAEVKKLIPNKPIRFLVNTHHHFDHSGGIRTYAAEGVTIITHAINKPFYSKLFKGKIVGIRDKHVLTDGMRTVELHHIKGSTHHDGIIMAYLPKEKLLIEVDVFTPPPPNAPAPATPNPFSVNLFENIQRLNLQVEQITPLHGRLTTIEELKKSIGRTG